MKFFSLLLFSSFFSLVALGAVTERVLVVGVENPPYSFYDKSGEPQGINVDMWKLWSEKMGIEVEYIIMDEEQAERMVKLGTADIIDGLLRSEENEKYFDFSQPYLKETVSIYYHKMLSGIGSPRDLSGFTVAVVRGEPFSNDLPKENINIQYYDSCEEVIKAAVEGKVKIFVTNDISASYYLIKYGVEDKFKKTSPSFLQNMYAAIKKGSEDLLETVNEGLKQITLGERRKIIEKWNGVVPFDRELKKYYYWLAGILALILFHIFISKMIYGYFGKKLFRIQNVLEKMKTELKLKNRDIDFLYDHSTKLATRLSHVLSLSSRLTDAALKNDEVFLKELLEMAMKLIPTADYGSISVIEDGKWKYVHAIGHDIEKLKAIDLKEEYFIDLSDGPTIITDLLQRNYSKMPEEIARTLEEATRAFEESMVVRLTVNGKFIGGFSLEIAKGSKKRFTEEDLQIFTALAELAKAFQTIRQYIIMQGKFQKELVFSVVRILDLHDASTRGHSERVAELAALTAEVLGLPSKDIKDAYWAGLVHDIGKLLIPKEILDKPAKLTDEELALVKKHPFWGYKVLVSSERMEKIGRIRSVSS